MCIPHPLRDGIHRLRRRGDIGISVARRVGARDLWSCLYRDLGCGEWSGGREMASLGNEAGSLRGVARCEGRGCHERRVEDRAEKRDGREFAGFEFWQRTRRLLFFTCDQRDESCCRFDRVAMRIGVTRCGISCERIARISWRPGSRLRWSRYRRRAVAAVRAFGAPQCWGLPRRRTSDQCVRGVEVGVAPSSARNPTLGICRH